MWNSIMKLYDIIEDMPPLYTDILYANIAIDLNDEGKIKSISVFEKPFAMNVPSTLAAENRSISPAPYPIIDLLKNMTNLYFSNLSTMMEKGVVTKKLKTFFKCFDTYNFCDFMETYAQENKLKFKTLCPYITIEGEPLLDSELYTKYNRYYEKYMLKKEGKWEMSLLSGENAYCTLFGKRKLLPDTPTAKIYSSNYTKFHPTETGKAKPDAYIGITDSYKFHHALRYLIRNGKKWGNMTLIAWCPSGNIANPLQSVQEYIMNATGEVMDHVNFNGDLYSEVIETDTNLFNTLDTIREMYIKKYKKMMIHVVGLTSVTQGCINTVYRAEIPAELYFNNLTNYYKNGIQSYYDYYRFDGIQSILRVLDSRRRNDVGSFLSLLNYAIYNSNITYNVMRKMMNQYDIMMYDKWYAFQYFNKFFGKLKDKNSFSYIMGRWVGICAAVSSYSINVTNSKVSIDSKLFHKIKNAPFEYMSELNKQLNLCEQALSYKASYLIDIKNNLSIKLADGLCPRRSACDINYYLGYEDQIKEDTEINLEKKEKNLLLNEVDE